MKGKIIPFIDIKTAIPVVRLYLDDNTMFYGIVDSGSDTTVFDLEFVKNNKDKFSINKTTMKVEYTGINSSETMPVIQAKTFIYNSPEDTNRILVSGEILNISSAMNSFEKTYNIRPDAIIGSELLKELDAKIDYENRELVIKHDLPSKQ